jgi:hypothetical protein
VAVAVVVVALVLGGLTYYCAYAGSGCSADDGALEAAAEDCAQDCAAAGAYQGSFAGADSALTVVVVVVVVAIAVVVVVVASAAAVAHAVVVGVVSAVLRWKNAGGEQEGNEEDRLFKLGHFGLDADFGGGGTPPPSPFGGILDGSYLF